VVISALCVGLGPRTGLRWPLIPRILRGLHLTHDMSGGMLHILSTHAMCPKTISKLVLCLTRLRYLIHKSTKKISIN